jgi:prepilin-type N-terminal cleavage/methylation domain-containing protein
MSMSPPRSPSKLREERGYTLVELLVAMAMGTVIAMAAFSLLEFTTSDVSRINERSHVDQTGRVALERIVLQLHSSCVAPTVTPILPGSGEKTIKFISETSPLNEHGEPVSSLSKVRLHEIVYTPAAEKKEGTLIEKSWPSSGSSPEYKFNEKEAPTEVKLLTGVRQSINPETKALVPVFQYYRYYRSSESGAKLGLLNTTAATVPLASEEEAEEIAKVTISFTLAPEGHESATFGNDRPVVLEDSTVLRLAPSSEAAGNPNLPCSQQT